MIWLLETDIGMSRINVLFAAVFMVGGVFMVIQTLRHSLLKSKMAVEEEVRRKQARAEYWRTMESAVNNLSTLIGEID
ncbi:MAG: hypothetical protein KDB07_07970, partial [Planctomycetes bacterium]|nr:hypothetical protein [Planctomycetota bacterium]